MEGYQYLIIPFITLFLAQIIKFIIESIFDKKWKWARLFNGSGGMPSSHSSFVSSLTMLIGLNEGIESPLFAMSLVFALIVAYDSLGLRKESGLHAEALNKIGEEIFSIKNYKVGFKHLKEKLGHNPIEVFMGIVLGIMISCIYYLSFIS
ncbi:MAG: divergent PAP2 family protein [Bacilli bacterium]|nr:divergent PAP2 family protein [Bacilli bacterium]